MHVRISFGWMTKMELRMGKGEMPCTQTFLTIPSLIPFNRINKLCISGNKIFKSVSSMTQKIPCVIMSVVGTFSSFVIKLLASFRILYFSSFVRLKF